MHFTTIWTLSACTLSEKLERTRDWFAQKVAKHLPLRIRYFTALQEISRAMMESPDIPATDLSYILIHLQVPKNLS